MVIENVTILAYAGPLRTQKKEENSVLLVSMPSDGNGRQCNSQMDKKNNSTSKKNPVDVGTKAGGEGEAKRKRG